MMKNNIEFGMKEVYDCGRMKEYRFGYRYGTYQEHLALLGIIRIPITGVQKESQFISAVTKALADVWGVAPKKKPPQPTQKH